jgi:hypothetical protein
LPPARSSSSRRSRPSASSSIDRDCVCPMPPVRLVHSLHNRLT